MNAVKRQPEYLAAHSRNYLAVMAGLNGFSLQNGIRYLGRIASVANGCGGLRCGETCLVRVLRRCSSYG